MGFILDILIGINLALLAYGLYKGFFKWVPRYLDSVLLAKPEKEKELNKNE